MLEQNSIYPIEFIQSENILVLHGGNYPSGSLKHLTFGHYLGELPANVRGIVEISASSTSLALVHYAAKLGLPYVAVCDKGGEDQLRNKGYTGETYVYKTLDEAFGYCEAKEKQGWHWPRQLTNPKLVDSVTLWAKELSNFLEQRQLKIKKIFCGLGTGASAAGLWKVFSGQSVEIMCVEAPVDKSFPGWRHYNTQNLGFKDLFHPYSRFLRRLQASANYGTCTEALKHIVRENSLNELNLVICHDSKCGSERLLS